MEIMPANTVHIALRGSAVRQLRPATCTNRQRLC